MEIPMFRRVLFVALIAIAGMPCARADSPAVTAVLTSSEAEVDQPVQLQIKVTGGSGATPPSDIAVDGLDIRYSGSSQEFRLNGLNASSSVVYNYTVLPLKAGTFTIPPQVVHAAGGLLRTPALTLNVAPNDGAAAGSRRGANALDERKMVFAELVIPRTSAYVGEIVPAEIRLGFNTRVRARLADGPNLIGQGFTTQRMPQPQQSIETIDGRAYQVVTFKTAIAAARSGKFEIGPVEAKAIVQVPRRSGSRTRSPFDIFGMDDPFSDPFFNDPFAGLAEQREIKIQSQPVTLEVKPLPPNAPPGFSGAVGIFNLTTDVKPKTAQIGDPLTATASISGRGNFDRVTAPIMESDRGWHTYPPSSTFKPDDDIGISGTKSFELVLTPNERKDAVPPLIFTYFDPLKEKYVTLKGDKLPVVVEGGAAPAVTPAFASSSVPTTPVAAGPTPESQAQDILYQVTDHENWGQTFAPIFMCPVFWTAQAVPLLGLIGFFGWKSRQRRLENREAQKRATWEHETSELQKKLRRADESPDRYFAEALRLVQLKTALARKVEPNTVDAESAVAAFQLSGEKRDRVRELFRRSDELRYSGGQDGDGMVAEETRHEVLELIDSLS